MILITLIKQSIWQHIITYTFTPTNTHTAATMIKNIKRVKDRQRSINKRNQ